MEYNKDIQEEKTSSFNKTKKMKSNTFVTTLTVFAKYSKYCLEYKKPWYLKKVASMATWFISLSAKVESVEAVKDDEDCEDYEDYWTARLAVHRVYLSNGQELPVLCETPSHAWDKIENWLLAKNDLDTAILKITRDEW